MTDPSPLSAAQVGVVPIVWNNVDIEDLTSQTPVDIILDAIARLRYAGCQFGRGFPEGSELRAALAGRGLRLAEVYAELPCTADGLAPDALDVGRARLAILHEAGGDVLVPALRVGGGRSEWVGRAGEPGAPRLSDPAWRGLAAVVDTLGREAVALGHRVAWHGHAGTYVETPEELERLMALTDPDVVGVCLDVGHYTVGGGDPVEAVRRFGQRVTHVHLKDVDPEVLASLRLGELTDFVAAIRNRLFTELGAGLLDLRGILRALADREFDGWLMVEQDSTWLQPGEAAAVGRGVLDFALRELAADLAPAAQAS
jgi:inosose dehydratase